MQRKKNNMKKTYTKKQITEAIAYWNKQLNKLDESSQIPRPSTYKSTCLALLAHIICGMRKPVKDADGNGDLKQALTDVFVQYSGGDQANDYTSTEIRQLLAKPLTLGNMKIPLAVQHIPSELQYFMPFKRHSEEEIGQLLKDAPEE